MTTSDASNSLKDQINKIDIETYKIVADHFNQDLREFWNRANFYLITNTGLFSAFILIYPTLLDGYSFLVSLVPIIGLSIALLWFLVLKGSLHWIDKWRQEMIKLSNEIDRFHCFASIESELTKKKIKSPSYLTQVMPLIFFVAWILILVYINTTWLPFQ